MVEIKILINGVEQANDRIKLESGFTFKETITDELENKIVIFLVSHNNKNLLKVNDIIEIQREVEGTFRDKTPFLVWHLERELFTKMHPYYWKITAILVEPTKILERITLPPCAFTNSMNTLQQIFSKVLDKAIIKRGVNPQSKFNVSSNLASLIANTTGEDFVYNKPVLLREVLDDLLLLKNARIKVLKKENGIIYLDYKLLSYENKAIKDINLLEHFTLKGLKEIESANGIANTYETYVNEVITQSPIQDNWRVFKPKEADILTSQDYYYCFDKPIEHMEKFEVLVKVKWTLSHSDPLQYDTMIVQRYEVLDLTDSFVEEDIYNLTNESDQRYKIPYKRKEKYMYCLEDVGTVIGIKIENRTHNAFLARQVALMQDSSFMGEYDVLNYKIIDKNGNELETDIWNYQNFLFRAKYYAYIDQHYKFTKANNDLGTILVSPNESLIDSDRFADKMFNITKSQGNKRLEADILVANYFQDLNEILVGDRFWYENKLYTVIEREKGFYKEHVKDHIVLEADYIPEIPEKLSRERQIFKNPIDKTITRDILVHDKVVFNLTNTNYGTNTLFNLNQLTTLLKNSLIHRLEPPKLNGYLFANGVHFIYNITPVKVKNSVIYNFGFLDNYSAGYTKDVSTLGGFKVGFNPYVDSNGEVENISIQFLSNNYDEPNYSTTDLADLMEHLENLPKVRANDIADYYDYKSNNLLLKVQKDRLEHITFTYQLEFLSSEEVIIGPEFINVFNLVGRSNSNFKIYASKTLDYRDGDRFAKGLEQFNATITDAGLIEITGLDEDVANYKSFAICIGNDRRLVLGFNNNFHDKKRLRY